jgi:hypothetical protein
MVSYRDRYSHYTTDHSRVKSLSPRLDRDNGPYSEEPRMGKPLTRGSVAGAGRAASLPAVTHAKNQAIHLRCMFLKLIQNNTTQNTVIIAKSKPRGSMLRS